MSSTQRLLQSHLAQEQDALKMEDHIHQQHYAAHSGHGHGHDYAAANRTHFDDIAHQFDEYPGALELAQKQVAVIKEKCEVHFDEEKTTVLDFACGTGESILQRC